MLLAILQKMKSLAEKKRLLEKKKMQQAIEEARLFEQAKRNAARYRQETAELAAYERQYGKVKCQQFMCANVLIVHHHSCITYRWDVSWLFGTETLTEFTTGNHKIYVLKVHCKCSPHIRL